MAKADQGSSGLVSILCTAEGILTQANTVTWINLATGDASVAEGLDVSVNGAGYNVLDGLVYVWDYDNSGVGRFGADNAYEFLGLPSSLPVANYNIGDVDADGFLWLSTSGATQLWYQIDVRQGSATFLQVLSSGAATRPSSVSNSGVDWSYVPGHPGALYMVGRSRADATQAVLLRFDAATSTINEVANLGSFTSTTLNVGATYADSDGFLYASDNTTGTIIRVNVDAATAALFSMGPPSSVNDGAACTQAAQNLDFGDGPDSYRSSLAQNGARHSLMGWNAEDHTASLMLGTHVTREGDALLIDADADDALASPPSIALGEAASVAITVTNATDADALLTGWFDANGDGDFDDPGEALAPIAVAAGTDTSSVSLELPAVTAASTTWLRLRLYSSTDAEASAYGSAAGGEVEDWQVDVVDPAPGLAAAKSVAPRTYSATGDTLSYTVTVTNTGNTRLHGVSATDPLCDLSDGPDELAPGASGTYTCEYAVTDADVTAGSVLNTVRAEATAGAGSLSATANAEAIYAPPTPTPTPSPTTEPTEVADSQDGGDDDTLAYTGFDSLPVAAAGLLLLAGGTALIATGHLRRLAEVRSRRR